MARTHGRTDAQALGTSGRRGRLALPATLLAAAGQ